MNLRVSLILVAVMLIVSNCSKSSGMRLTLFHDPLTHGEWKLLRSDTTLYDSAYNVTGHHSADLSSCDRQRHLILLRNGDFEGYVGCVRPSNLQAGGYWTGGGDWGGGSYLDMYEFSSPRSGPVYAGIDSIELCNWDSLVVFERVSPHDFYSSFYSPIPVTVQSWWGH
jgi:hypothetical protein